MVDNILKTLNQLLRELFSHEIQIFAAFSQYGYYNKSIPFANMFRHAGDKYDLNGFLEFYTLPSMEFMYGMIYQVIQLQR